VTLRLVELAQNYRLVVEDTGVGLPASFDPSASTGLGMRLVDSFVQNLEGTMTTEARIDGAGARFIVSFPK
jgi:two-component sensor histidine kinase